jgi:AcrR family transcriptional regulator
MKDSPGVTRTGRKFDQVLAGAREIFMRDGFEGANVDDIAKAAGVSKATLYSYFPDKRLLFTEIAQVECARMADRALELIDDAKTPREVLTIAASQIVPFLLTDFSQKIFRICMAERERFPELGRAFYAAGPEMGQQRIADYLTKAVDRGELVINDVSMAADQFAELCRAKLWMRAVFGIQDCFEQAEIDDVVQNAVETFLARYERK